MKRRIVDPPAAPEIIKRRITHTKKFALRALAVVAVTLCGVLAALWCFCFAVFKGPSPTARDRLTVYLSKGSVTRFVPVMFLGQEQVDLILEEAEQ